MKSQSSIEDDKVKFVLPADREYSTSFELNTTCGIMSNGSSITFSEAFNFIILAHVEFSYNYSAVSCFLCVIRVLVDTI